ncbi:hypothetical protein MKX67_04945 [Cytobacillus sp. FSL W7-1323]|uniref:hypothetical protein n=1 Tax=Cytobacillus TaxID=2675230 RepID=UPI0027800CFF|nr:MULTISPECIES: hypothetical protein [Cytobacillus]MDQ0186569.1 hypothetical protein [Cytobacillus kochii]MEA1854028.1 hypothetical protein [Cytobacillus sp. OWB-43]
MQDIPTLKLLDPLKKVFEKFDIDYEVMRAILKVKLTMDGRRTPTMLAQNSQKKDKGNQFIKSLWLYVLFGLFMIPLLFIGEHYLFQMSMFFGMFTFFIMTSMISDFSSVLLDIRDRNILYPKPINRRTVSAAKMMHIIIYLGYLSIALVTIPLIVGLIRHGILFLLLAVINLIFINLFVVVLTALFYFLILQFFDGEKLKDLINYVQIGLSLMIMVGYQLLARSFEIINLTITIEPQWWQVFIFPMWFAANMDLLLNQSTEGFYLLFAALSIIVPCTAIILYLKFNDMFEHSLQKLTYQGKSKGMKKAKWRKWLLQLFCRTQEERAFYRFASAMMKNERDFKLKAYPSLGFSIVIPFIFIFGVLGDNGEDLANSHTYLTIYFSLLVIPTIMLLMPYSVKYKGAWIYRTAPIIELKPIFSGTIKAFLVKLFLPPFLLLSLVFTFLYGLKIIPELIIVLLNAFTFVVICFAILKKAIPFTESFDQYTQTGNGIIAFFLMFLAGVFAILHYVSTIYPYGTYIYLGLAVLYLMVSWKVAFNIGWEKVIE